MSEEPTPKPEAKQKSKKQPLDVMQLLILLKKVKPLLRHHYFAVLFLLLCGLAYAVFEVNNTLGAASDETYKQQKTVESLRATFDQATIDKIEALQKSSENGSSTPVPKPGARTNPFAE